MFGWFKRGSARDDKLGLGNSGNSLQVIKDSNVVGILVGESQRKITYSRIDDKELFFKKPGGNYVALVNKDFIDQLKVTGIFENVLDSKFSTVGEFFSMFNVYWFDGDRIDNVDSRVGITRYGISESMINESMEYRKNFIGSIEEFCNENSVGFFDRKDSFIGDGFMSLSLFWSSFFDRPLSTVFTTKKTDETFDGIVLGKKYHDRYEQLTGVKFEERFIFIKKKNIIAFSELKNLRETLDVAERKFLDNYNECEKLIGSYDSVMIDVFNEFYKNRGKSFKDQMICLYDVFSGWSHVKTGEELYRELGMSFFNRAIFDLGLTCELKELNKISELVNGLDDLMIDDGMLLRYEEMYNNFIDNVVKDYKVKHTRELTGNFDYRSEVTDTDSRDVGYYIGLIEGNKVLERNVIIENLLVSYEYSKKTKSRHRMKDIEDMLIEVIQMEIDMNDSKNDEYLVDEIDQLLTVAKIEMGKRNSKIVY